MSRHSLPIYSLPRHSSLRHVLAIAIALSLSGAVLAGPPIALADSRTKHSTESLARRALTVRKDESASAIAELRSMGPDGLRAFLEANRLEIEAALKTHGESHDADSPDRLPLAQNNQVLLALDSL